MQTDPILERFDTSARRGRDAVLVEGRGRAATRGAVDALARSLALRIANANWTPGAAVSLQCPNGPSYLAAWLALRRAGMPVLLLDDTTPDAARATIEHAVGAAGCLRCEDGWSNDARAFCVESSRAARPLPRAAVLKSTSGTTGEPRGVAVTAAALLADTDALWRSMELRPDERILASLPWPHSYGFSTIVLPALVDLGMIVAPDGEDALAAGERSGASFFPTAPPYLQALTRRAADVRLPATLRRVISAGSALHPATAGAFRERFGLPAHTFYGASEAGGISFDRRGDAAERGTVGTPIDGVQVTVEERVVVRSAAVADRYVPDPGPDLADGCYRSQDLAEWRDGEIALVGRVTPLINVDGRKVSPDRIRDVLLALAGVQDAIVYGRAEPESGREHVQAVIAAPQADLDYRTVRAWCRRHLPAYQVPRGISIVPAIPHNARGKPDISALRHPAG